MQASLARDHDLHKRRAGRNIGVLAALGLMVALIFSVSLVKVRLDPESVQNPTANADNWGATIAKWWAE